MAKLISIIIAAFNEEQHIEFAISSCLQQTYKNVEIIVVDDGSSDDTWKILTSLQQKNPGKILVHRFFQNRGKVAAFNKAFEMSSGDFIAVMGADDVSVPDRIEFSQQNIGDFDLLFGDLRMFDDITGKVLSESLMERSLGINFDREFSFSDLLRKPTVFGGTIYAKRSALENVFPVDENLAHEDWWIPLCIAVHKNIKYCHKVLCEYRIHANQDTVLNNRFSSYERWRAFRVRDIPYYEKVLKSFEIDEDMEQFIQERVNRDKLADEKMLVRLKAVASLNSKNWLDLATALHPIFRYWWMKRKHLYN